MLQKLVRWVQEGNKPRPSPEAANFTSLAAKPPSAEPAAAPLGAEPPVQSAPPAADAQTKLASARCDLHPLHLLAEAHLGADTPGAQRIRALRCHKDGCSRHYLVEYGYFNYVPGEQVRFDGMEGKRTCTSGHASRSLVLTKLNGSFVWACPESGCPTTVPYEETAPPQMPAQPDEAQAMQAGR